MKGVRATPGRAFDRARADESNHQLLFRCSFMMRATFFAIGLFVALWGGAFLVIDKLVLASDEAPVQAGFRGLFGGTAAAARKTGARHSVVGQIGGQTGQGIAADEAANGTVHEGRPGPRYRAA